MATYLGIKPFSFQRDVIDEVINDKGTGKTVVVKSRRQIGKTTLIANLLLYFAINYPGTRNYNLSPTLKQGKAIFRTIINATSKSGIVQSKNGTDLLITLINGSSISFKSAEQRESLRGESVTGILCIDEAAYISDDVYNIIKPWTDFHKAVTLIVSTPYIKDGFFFRYYNYGLNGENNTVSIDWSDPKYQEDLDLILPPDKLKEYEKVLPRKVFQTEYLSQFLDDEGSVFTNISNCLEEHSIEPTDKLYVGIDWSNQLNQDYTVVTIFNEKGQMVHLRYFRRESTTKQIGVICTELEPYAKQIQIINCESNSIGLPYIELMKEKSQVLSRKVNSFLTTNKSKNEMVENMQIALEQRNVTLLPDNRLKQEFGYFTATYNPSTRNVSYSAPAGLHDDIVMSTLIAYDGLKKGKITGKYYLG